MKREYYDPILRKRQEITEKYTYSFHTLPTAPPPPPVSPRRKKQIIPKNTNFKDVGKIVNEIEGTTILTYPHNPIKDLRKEVQDSNARLLYVKTGHPLSMMKYERPEKCQFQQTKTIRLQDRLPETPSKSPTLKSPKNSPSKFTSNSSNQKVSPSKSPIRRSPRVNSIVYVYPENPISDSPASTIQNEFNLFRHKINEVNRQRYNTLAYDLNLRNRRRDQEMSQMYEDMKKYGIEQTLQNVKRARQYSSLKDKREEYWWFDFIESIPEELRNRRTLRMINEMSEIPFFDEENIKNFLYRNSNTPSNEKLCHKLIILANEEGNFIDESRMEMVFYLVDKMKRKENES
ncbi:hypothetical protein TRFO_05037 [Tritrichomonas foetus]|uniref:Uncharacterized protein n=1 Tax=Tritrichomonas foetus TaxID=1144522 RepID=A0A1J4K9L3_9EUKA|nr:hypothetical protein TRFO_05037 [Tritrichomonas foetus]|eukprot:OHT07923.1 hypothetical protein TRFO_05037 [Tritrichomonas foetus]